MKISELIRLLQAQLETNGDLKVYHTLNGDVSVEVDLVLHQKVELRELPANTVLLV